MSALLSESDLNDFISPSLACIKPTEVKKETAYVTEDGEYQVGVEPAELDKVSISLSDCLACSGCITSSEEIMLQKQSHTVFLDAWRLEEDRAKTEVRKKLVVSMSPQCRVSLGKYYGIHVDQVDYCMLRIFKEVFHTTYFVGTELGRVMSIRRTVEKLQEKKADGSLGGGPALSSICPGFVVYAEKTKPEIVPLLLNVKSSQQITGVMLQETLGRDTAYYHLVIMPCFDKKLEASRPDSDGEVDCVITPKEVVTMFTELDIPFHDYLRDFDVDVLAALRREMSPPGWHPQLHWSVNLDGSSGGYAYQYVLAQQQRAERDPAVRGTTEIRRLPGKNNDIVEYRLVQSDTSGSKKLASACELSGFRNIQNMCRALSPDKKKTALARKRGVTALRKRGRETPRTTHAEMAEPYTSDYIEVNACPGGSINGGGLLGSSINDDTNTSAKRRTQMVQEMNHKYFAELPLIEPLDCAIPMPQLVSTDDKRLQYEFHPVTRDQEKDLVTVGNTW
ncbi:Cytosolic Fe-S cluster assembly factor NAR1 [Nakaseomyces bracarensis]|uniref:Cytosolic Fe-S cluster assembly factor NAR1 n=1 Tax=Nakaseomyces bracarensis TaxID=273131 RepID=A0ABR4NYH5_9SACH